MHLGRLPVLSRETRDVCRERPTAGKHGQEPVGVPDLTDLPAGTICYPGISLSCGFALKVPVDGAAPEPRVARSSAVRPDRMAEPIRSAPLVRTSMLGKPSTLVLSAWSTAGMADRAELSVGRTRDRSAA